MKPEKTDIESIVERIAINNDQVAFREFFEYFYPRLVHYSCSFTNDYAASEDIVGEVFITVWNNREKLVTIEHIENYLYVSTKNRTLNHQRNTKKLHHTNLDVNTFTHITTRQNPESELLDKELFDTINNAIDSLPKKGKQIYRMIKEDKLSYQQVASLLDISKKTVDAHLSSVVKKIRKAIKDYQD